MGCKHWNDIDLHAFYYGNVVPAFPIFPFLDVSMKPGSYFQSHAMV